MRIVVLGLSLSSSWGNGHATTYRALLAGLAARGHAVTFLEREQPWYAANRDLRDPGYCRLEFYDAPDDLHRFAATLRSADAVIVGSYVPDGVAVVEEVCRILGRPSVMVDDGRTPRVMAGEDRAARVMAGEGRPSTSFVPARGDASRGWPAFAGHDTGGHDAQTLLCFYDIDTPVTLRKLADGDTEYLSPEHIPAFDFYFSFTGGPILRTLETHYGARAARALYCSVDPEKYRPTGAPQRWALGYLGTYSADRQPALERLLLQPARRLPHLRFVVAGSMYPADIAWPENVDRIEHLPPDQHAGFYSSLGWALNVTRADMLRAGYSPSVRLFEATACGTPVISDPWPGLDTLFEPGREILTAADSDAVQRVLTLPEPLRQEIARAGRRRSLQQHTAAHRAEELETHLRNAAAQAAPAEQGAVS